jgi:hypothetical protein
MVQAFFDRKTGQEPQGFAGYRGLIVRGSRAVLPLRPAHDLMQYPSEVLNRAADIFRMAGHMLGKRLLLRPGIVVSVVDDDVQP